MPLPEAVDWCAAAARLARKSDVNQNSQMARQIAMTGTPRRRVAASFAFIPGFTRTYWGPDKARA